MARRGILFLLSLFLTFPLWGEVKFMNGTFADAVKSAEAQKKPIMIDFMTDWCRWCDTLDHRTYTDPRVADFVNSRLIPIKIDAEKGEGIELAKKYGVRAYPTILLITSNGEEIDRLLGYIPAEPFVRGLEDCLSGKNTVGALNQAIEKNPHDVDAIFALGSKYQERGDATGSVANFEKVLALDPSNTKHHNEDARFAIAVQKFRGEGNPGALQSYIATDSTSPRATQAYAFLISYYLKQKEGQDAKVAFERYLSLHPSDAAMMNNYAWLCFQNTVDLDHAALVAEKAVSLAATNDEKAMYIDTQAAVEFARSHNDRAVALEQQALGLLQGASEKDRKPYEEALAKYKNAN